MKRMIMLTIALLAISIFVLPVTLSLFSGQHCWYNLSAGGNQVPCEKCHADVAEEMNALAGPHTGETGFGRLKCSYCHRLPPVWRRNTTFENYTYASGDGTGSQPGVESHAASTIPCMYCHSGDKSGVKHTGWASGNCWGCHQAPNQNPNYRPAHEGRYTNSEDCRRCHGNAHTGDVYYIPPAGGFSLTTNASDTGSHAAHKTFVMNAISNPDMEDANEACIGCHTKIRVESNFNVTSSLMISVNDSYNLSASYWNVVNISPDGYITYKEVKEG